VKCSPPGPVFTLFFLFSVDFTLEGPTLIGPDLKDIQPREKPNMDTPWLRRLKQVNGELGLLLSLFLIRDATQLHGEHAPCGSWFLRSPYDLLCLLLWPAARHAHRRGKSLPRGPGDLLSIPGRLPPMQRSPWPTASGLTIAVWGGTLMVMAYAMGTLYDNMQAKVRELRETYNGLLIIPRQFISKDQYNKNHPIEFPFMP